VARSQAALAVLFHVPGAYSLKGLYDYVFDERCRKAAIAAAEDALVELQVRAADGDLDASLDSRRLKSAIDYEATIAAQYTDKERSGVNRTIETALARFADPELEDAFCTDAGAQANLADVLNGSVFVVNVPRDRFKAAANVVYLFVKERFFQAVNARAQLPAGPRKSRPLLFLCDEYQQICSAGDAQFFDTSRALGVIGIVASQSIEAYIAAIGNEHAATALLGNFTNIVAFRSTERTMDYVAGKLGEVDVWKETTIRAALNSRPSSSRVRGQCPRDTRPRRSASDFSRHKHFAPSAPIRPSRCSLSTAPPSTMCSRARNSPTTIFTPISNSGSVRNFSWSLLRAQANPSVKLLTTYTSRPITSRSNE